MSQKKNLKPPNDKEEENIMLLTTKKHKNMKKIDFKEENPNGSSYPDADNKSVNTDGYGRNNAFSDSELMEVVDLKAKKNKSNLHLIKSFSFIDKTNGKLRQLRQKPSSPELENKHIKNVKTSKSKQKTTKIQAPEIKKEKTKNMLKKSKSFNEGSNVDKIHIESKENLNELLRKRDMSENGNDVGQKQKEVRPKSMPITAPAAKSFIKRGSFLRQSFQSIRRSLSVKKKNSNENNNKTKGTKSKIKNKNPTTYSSTTSNSSTSSSNYAKDLDALFAIENKNGGTEAGIKILLNGVDVEACASDMHGTSRSTNSVTTLPNGTEEATSNDSTSIISANSKLSTSHNEKRKFECLNHCDETNSCVRGDTEADELNKAIDVEYRQKPQYQHQLSLGSTTSQSGGYYSSLKNNSCQSQNYSKRGLRALKQNKSDTAIPSRTNLGLSSLTPVGSSNSVHSVSPTASRVSVSGSISSNNSDNTAKNEQSTAAAVGSSTAVAATAGSTTGSSTEKEKKRKEVSSSRVKKFHRHFSQVPKDEKLINYFSCALVSDILLQGHLYITEQHFAFYSNVFGYVTKVVIPTSSVTKISKEKTAKIIPNAVGVATADERHVFGSFISREAAFRLMCSVCPPMAPTVMLPKTPGDIEISEEYSIEDDSSCSISGNESPPGNSTLAALTTEVDTGQTLLRRTILSSSLNNSSSDKKANSSDKQRYSDIPLNAKVTSSTTSMPLGHLALRASAPIPATGLHAKTPIILPAAAQLSIMTTGAAASAATSLTMIIATGSTASTTTTASSTPTSATSTASSSPTTVMATPTAVSGTLPLAFHGTSNTSSTTRKSNKQSIVKAFANSLKTFSSQTSLRLKFPTELSIVYLGVILSIVLAGFSVFLLYRIVDIEARTNQYHSPLNFNWRSGHDDDIFAEALRWQRELQDKSTEEAQSILTTNLEQIAKVRRSLETLSMLIRDRSSAGAAHVNHDDSSN